jgi:hypothetical protein
VKSAAAAVSYVQHDRATRKKEEAGMVNKARGRGGKERDGKKRESIMSVFVMIMSYEFGIM